MEMGRSLFCLKIPHVAAATHVASNWKALDLQRKAMEFCDVQIKCNGHVFPAHKCVLASVSKYFKALFTSPCTLSGHPVDSISLDDFSVAVVTVFLDAAYAQKDIETMFFAELLRLADFLQYEWLLHLLVDEIRNVLNLDNILDWSMLANELEISKLLLLTQHFIADNFDKLEEKALERGLDLKSLVNAFQVDLTDVLIVESETNSSLLYTIDPVLGSCKQIDHPGIFEAFSKPNCYIEKFFTYSNVLYAAVLESLDKWPNQRIQLWKYHHCSYSFECVRRWEITTFMHMDNVLRQSIHVGHIVHPSPSESILYFHFDNCYASNTDRAYTFKVDFLTGAVAPGYILADHHIPGMDGKYGLDYSSGSLYNVENFDFDDNSNHTKIEPKLQVKKVAGQIPYQNFAELMESAESYVITSKYAATYIVVFVGAPIEDEDSYHQVYLLKLDVEKSTWVCVCSFFTGLQEYEVFEYSQGICFVTRPGDNMGYMKRLWFFNRSTETLQEVDIDWKNLRLSSLKTVPKHILV